MDLRLRGGTVIISRRVSPFMTWLSSWHMASMCQFGRKRPSPDTIGNEARTKE